MILLNSPTLEDGFPEFVKLGKVQLPAPLSFSKRFVAMTRAVVSDSFPIVPSDAQLDD